MQNTQYPNRFNDYHRHEHLHILSAGQFNKWTFLSVVVLCVTLIIIL